MKTIKLIQQFRLGVIADFSELESVSTVATSENGEQYFYFQYLQKEYTVVFCDDNKIMLVNEDVFGEQWEITKPEDVRSTLHK
ncbi:MAG: hypothetical protein SNH57_00730 [Rikenellaceae bacterium]